MDSVLEPEATDNSKKQHEVFRKKKKKNPLVISLSRQSLACGLQDCVWGSSQEIFTSVLLGSTRVSRTHCTEQNSLHQTRWISVMCKGSAKPSQYVILLVSLQMACQQLHLDYLKLSKVHVSQLGCWMLQCVSTGKPTQAALHARNTEYTEHVKKDVPYKTWHPDLQGPLDKCASSPGLLGQWLAECRETLGRTLRACLLLCITSWQPALDPFGMTRISSSQEPAPTIQLLVKPCLVLFDLTLSKHIQK